MATEAERAAANTDSVNNIVEAALRIGLIFILLAGAYGIVRPFLVPIVWGGIIAIALMPVTLKVKGWLGGRHGTAAAVVAILGISLLITPTIVISESLFESGQKIASTFEKGDVQVPPPPASVAEWPVIGEPVFGFWKLASTNLQEALKQVQPQLQAVGAWLLGAVAGGATGVLMFVISLAIAGVFMAKSDAAEAWIKHLSIRMIGDRGVEWTEMSSATVRSVVQGVLGVAVIQALMAGIGLFLIQVPAAGVWTVLVLLLAIVQLPPLLILGPIIAYVWSYADTTPAILFTVWSLIVSASDAFLKPLLLGRGLDVPMPIILLGAIGGMMASGIIGLFIGAVILAIWYKLFGLWLESERA